MIATEEKDWPKFKPRRPGAALTGSAWTAGVAAPDGAFEAGLEPLGVLALEACFEPFFPLGGMVELREDVESQLTAFQDFLAVSFNHRLVSYCLFGSVDGGGRRRRGRIGGSWRQH